MLAVRNGTVKTSGESTGRGILERTGNANRKIKNKEEK